ncbi:putative E3 ubiquitin-protein ligase HERC4 [Glycine soja]
MDIDAIFGTIRPVSVPRKSAIYVWGYNQSGQTGRKGKEDQLRIPKQLPPELFGCPAGTNARWLDVACGREHTAAIASDGSLFTWGANDFGQLGDGTEERRKLPEKVKQLESEFVKSVSCGAHCSACIAEPHENDGTISTRRLWVWGQNQGSNLPRLFWGAFKPNTIIREVSCGAVHVVAFYTWGLGNMGQLGHSSLQYGDKELLPRRVVTLDGIFIKDVACGGVHTCSVTQGGALYAWGGGRSGQLGLGPQTGLFSCVANDSQTFFRNIPVLVVPKGVQLVACGYSHTLISMSDGRIHGWGYNNYGQAANEKCTYAWYPSPIDWCVGEVRKLAAGGGHSAVLTDAYSLKELCEFVLADSMTLSNAAKVEDIAYRTGSDALARLCGRLREYMLAGGALEQKEEMNSKI